MRTKLTLKLNTEARVRMATSQEQMLYNTLLSIMKKETGNGGGILNGRDMISLY